MAFVDIIDRALPPKEIVSYVENFRKSITVLVYDIRGSSYMGIKLHDAQKEQKIKYKFAKEMAEIAKKYNAFLLKDTGDGGIVWFAENSGSLYDHLYAESVTGRGTKLRYSIFSGGEFELNPAADSAKRAILCARDMVLKAEEFIKANFMHYREWFAAITEPHAYARNDRYERHAQRSQPKLRFRNEMIPSTPARKLRRRR